MPATNRVALLAAALLAVTACKSDQVTSPPPLAGPTCGPSTVVQLSISQATTLDCASGTLINLAGGATYLIVPQFAMGGIRSGVADVPVPYQIGVASSGSRSVTAPGRGATLPVPQSTQQQFDAHMQARNRLLARSLTRERPIGVRGFGADRAVTLPEVGSLRDFRVLAGSLQQPTVATATARLSFLGSNILLYIDTLAPANGFSAEQLQSFGVYFDQVLYAIGASAFGPPSDIDGNGRIIMLLSPRVNAITTKADCQSQGYVAGYFDGIDLVSSGARSNQGEVFYAAVPDPAATVSCAHTVAQLAATVPATFLHELQHLINFSQHVVLRGALPEEGWLDEGLSIRAEELGSEYFERRYPSPAGRTNPAQIFPDSSQGFVSGFLSDSYAFLLQPDTASVTLHSDAENGFAWRGGDWLLVHWLGDLKGTSVYTALEQSRLTGIANIATAAGEPFASLFGDFSLALWTDSVPGSSRASIPARNRFQTRNLRQLYQRLFANASGNPAVPRAYPVLPTTLSTTSLTTGSMVPGTMAFYTMDLRAVAATTAVQFAAIGGGRFSASLHPQVSVFRLPN